MVAAEGGSSLKDGTSRVTGDCQARNCEELGVRFPGLTRRWLEFSTREGILPSLVCAGLIGREA
jgi:hypothetical protein